DNIKRAIQRGSGELEGSALEEIMYEGYGPGGIAVLIETVTDNRNRTVAEMRHLLSRNGGSMAEAGAVSWNFNRMGVVTIPRTGIDEDTLMMESLDAGAEDVKSDEENFEVYCPIESFEQVRKMLEEKKYNIASASLQYVPKTLMKIEQPTAEAVLKFMEAIEEHDDVQNVFSNFDIDEKVLSQIGN
ncbi:MAG TPA: YebC/PmpR family DNA-binding transcriptional regulator, partial [Candidatus Kapabacteria bacterium]|nr:YebC/PmpR family DNA-binding transcriptional regulator [Candidatus Kapabacteria bacterium]